MFSFDTGGDALHIPAPCNAVQHLTKAQSATIRFGLPGESPSFQRAWSFGLQLSLTMKDKENTENFCALFVLQDN